MRFQCKDELEMILAAGMPSADLFMYVLGNSNNCGTWPHNYLLDQERGHPHLRFGSGESVPPFGCWAKTSAEEINLPFGLPSSPSD